MSVSDFLHGAETINVETLGGTIKVVKAGVIGLLGISDEGPVNELILCNNESDDAQFGAATPKNNIALSLKIIREMAGSCPVQVVNVYNNGSHKQSFSVDVDITGGKATLAKHIVGDPADVTLVDDNGDPIEYEFGTDYTLDKYGNFVDITGDLEDTTVTFGGYTLNLTSPGTALVGGTDEDGVRTGAALFNEGKSKFGFNAKILISPTFSTISSVYVALRSLADTLRARFPMDAPAGTTFPGALAGRGPSGTIGWNTSHQRSILLYPQMKTPNLFVDADLSYPYSAFYAGAMMWNILNRGYWYSPSNIEMTNVTGTDVLLTSSFTDSNAENQQLNAAGIVTYLNVVGSGYRVFGNRNASFPTSTDVKNFIALQTVDDVLAETMEDAALPYLDLPITKAIIDIIKESGNNLLAALIQRGALLPGSTISYNPEDNSDSELANGHVVFERSYMAPPPLERLTYKNKITISLLSKALK